MVINGVEMVRCNDCMTVFPLEELTVREDDIEVCPHCATHSCITDTWEEELPAYRMGLEYGAYGDDVENVIDKLEELMNDEDTDVLTKRRQLHFLRGVVNNLYNELES